MTATFTLASLAEQLRTMPVIERRNWMLHLQVEVGEARVELAAARERAAMLKVSELPPIDLADLDGSIRAALETPGPDLSFVDVAERKVAILEQAWVLAQQSYRMAPEPYGRVLVKLRSGNVRAGYKAYPPGSVQNLPWQHAYYVCTNRDANGNFEGELHGEPPIWWNPPGMTADQVGAARAAL